MMPTVKPLFHPQLVNDPFGDPALYIEFLFEKRALLFDLGEIQALPARKVLRVSHAFVSHTHMDHFIGFDHLLRICVGREKSLHMYGPPGFIAQLGHKLTAYSWNLVQNYPTNFTITATEYHPGGEATTARFRCRTGFQAEAETHAAVVDGVLLEEESFRVRAAHLDHRIPCLAFALEEKQHINVWKNRLDELGLPTGPWLRELKLAVMRGLPDDEPFRVCWREGGTHRERVFPLGRLKQGILRIVPGQKIAYVVDAIYHQDNAARIVELARGADLLFSEAYFLEEAAERAAHTYHLTAHQAGRLARAAGVKRLIPFHFSARYEGHEQALYREAERGFAGAIPGH